MGDSRKGESLAKGIEVMTAETRGELWVWVFSPAGSSSLTVFSTLETRRKRP